MTSRAILVLGLPRSGTRLVARILGRMPGTFLITEHGNKQSIPEETTSVVDSDLWWSEFAFPFGKDPEGAPYCEEPIHSQAAEESLAATYRKLAGAQRLIVKNPQNLLRLPEVKRIFPDAIPIWVVREPNAILRSILRKNAYGSLREKWLKRHQRQKFLLHSRDMLLIPRSDIVARAAHGLAYMAERYALLGGHVVRYEHLVSDPLGGITALYRAIGEDTEPDAETISLPKRLPSDQTKSLKNSGHRHYAEHCIAMYNDLFGYKT